MKRYLPLLLFVAFLAAGCGASVAENESSNIVTASGLEVIINEAGGGQQAQAGDRVAVNYTGSLADGTVFDSSEGREPIVFTIGAGEVIPGWDEGFAQLAVGDKATLIIPPELAYGAQGAGDVIPPNAILTFEVELVEILPPPTPPPPPTVIDEDAFVETASGLRYAFMNEAGGALPDFGSAVTVHFKLWLEDGSLLADSYSTAQPAPFTLGAEEIIPAWDEMVALMGVGDIAQLIVPPELGLGADGGGPIPPNATLIFELELLDFQPPPPPPTAVDEDAFIETESGLRYAFLEEGDGPIAASGDSVTVDYAGWLTNTIQFDNSYDCGEPFVLAVDTGSVIPGWDEVLQLMPEGSKVQVYIPGSLAYGETGRPGIPPNATLIFEIELLEVSPAEASE